MNVRLVQIDGKLPNIALMRISAWHRSLGDRVSLSRSVVPGLFDPRFGRVYGSAIFAHSKPVVDRMRSQYPDAIIGGTGTGDWQTVESVLGEIPNRLDYSIYPDFQPSIGFLQRGCRLRCKFCVVPKKEGRARFEQSVGDLWRGGAHPRDLHVLDNDFFGVPEWRDHIRDIRNGKFRICLTQGINVRMITEEAAAALASIEYRDSSFRRRRIYTAWDNLGDERRFFDGIDRLEEAGIPPRNVMAYMLVGYAKGETWEFVFHRFNRMVARGVLPYPMVYDRTRKDLKHFQRWAVTGLYRAVPFSEYRNAPRSLRRKIASREGVREALDG